MSLPVINKPIAVKCDHEWQKGFLVTFFYYCDNYFRLDEEKFMYTHFRTLKNVTFYTDSKGCASKERETYHFDEIFGLYLKN